MGQLIATAEAGTGDELAFAERLIAAYPDDARLHFLRGSFLAGSGRPIEAHASLSLAVQLAPDFHLARFQLGFFELTSAEPARALATWEPLGALPEDHYLSHFVAGLTHLIHDRFPETIRELEVGISANGENPPLNRDMALIIEQCGGLAPPPAAAEPVEEASATSFLLGQLGGRGTTH
ncbi:tetratricopeptide repeat protein [Sphingomonas sp. Leaf33]|uniref:tetratricopeptide repeat protein n=1 Tax=Sphingomonas sp. Leaf33 TaxID=1736215 RepID=UPI001F2B9AB2|nr:hypothetical protein [Sphingomonas sp. Leaf33]